MNIALTGITGMVGSHFIKKLLEDNDVTHPNSEKSATYNIKALIREGSVVEHLKTFEDIDYIIGGLEDKESLGKLVQDADILLHLAHCPTGLQTNEELIKVNIDGTFNLLEEARKAKVNQLIFMSSMTIFGDVLPTVNKENPIDENHPVRPASLYGAIKNSIEGLCFAFQKTRAFDITILRPAEIYGVKPQIDKSLWFQTIDYLATNYNVDVKGSMYYVSVDSVVQGIQCVMGNSETAGKIFHLLDDHIHNLNLAKMIAETIDSFGECEGVMGGEPKPMSNQAAKDIGVEFKGEEGIKEYIKLIHKLQGEYGGERNIQNW